MRVAEFMTKNVRTVPPTMPAIEARSLMRQERIRHLIVIADSNVVGVLSDRDAGGMSGASIRARATVADLMTDAVVTAAPDDTVRRVANLMRGRTIGCVPVLSGKRLIGMVTISDLLNLLGRGVDRPSRAERHALSHRAPHRKLHGAYGAW